VNVKRDKACLTCRHVACPDRKQCDWSRWKDIRRRRPLCGTFRHSEPDPRPKERSKCPDDSVCIATRTLFVSGPWSRPKTILALHSETSTKADDADAQHVAHLPLRSAKSVRTDRVERACAMATLLVSLEVGSDDVFVCEIN
jgi:hypothetical protein